MFLLQFVQTTHHARMVARGSLAILLFLPITRTVGLLSHPIKKSLFQEPTIAICIGIAVGLYALGWLDMAKWGEENARLEQAASITLAISLMGLALRFKKKSVRTLLRSVVWLLALGMIGRWLASSAPSAWLIGASFWTTLLPGGDRPPPVPSWQARS